MEHVYLEHNLYHYLDFLIYIESKSIGDCNGIEKYVKDCISKKSIEFFPLLEALSLQDNEND